MSLFGHEFEEIERLLRELLYAQGQVIRVLWRIEKQLSPHPDQIHHFFEGASMPITLTVGQTVLDTVTESNAQGPVPVKGADITFASSDTAVATVVNHGDGTATWTAVAVGTTTETFSDTVFNLSGTDTITVIEATPIPTSIEHAFGTPA